MVLAVAALLFQFSPVSLALPAAVPAHTTAAAVADTPLNANLTPDLSSARFTKNSAPTADPSSSAASSAGGLKPASIESAQNLQSLSGIRVPAFDSAKEHQIIQAERPSRRSWLALSLIQHGAATFDAYTTRQSISRGNVELDPTMRPFAHSPGLYAAIQVGPVILDIVARKMQHSPNNFVRHMWWLPQSVSTASFIYSGAHNLSVGNNP
jgi:hypothetical protein